MPIYIGLYKFTEEGRQQVKSFADRMEASRDKISVLRSSAC